MRTTTMVVAALIFGGCNCGQVTQTEDGGVDAGGMDAGSDAGTDAGTDAGRLTLPIYRVGPRSAFGGMFAQAPIAGSLALPVTGNTPADFTGWEIFSRVARGTVTMMSPRDDGGTREVELSVTVATASSGPQTARELFSARSADGGTVMLAVLDAQRELHFTIESTALQALALAEVRAENPGLEEAYYAGAQPGDRAELDSHVAAVAAAMKLRLASDGRTGLAPSGFAFPSGLVFDVIDSARSTPGVMKPVVTPGASGQHLTEVALSGAAGTLALWLGARVPQPVMFIPAGTTRVALFLYSFSPGAEQLYVKFATTDGGQSAASTRFQLAEPLGVGPGEPTLTLDAGEARACDLTAGHHVVFFASGTELSIGFAEAPVRSNGDCVVLRADQIPAGVGLLNAAQVAPDGRVGAPSNIVFP